MSFLFGGSRSAFDELVDNATSELLPAGSEDLALNFDICDQIRGKQVPPKDAMRSLKRRVLHKNPNVQILALKLTDTCVKNGGRHFVQEIASSEFLDAVVDQLRVPTLPHQVRVLILQYLQSWALACRGKPDLDLVYSTYSRLKAEGGWTFPPLPADDRLGGQAIMIDTSAPPEWTDSPHCERCRTVFTFTNRKHHCRACGKTFCGDCSAKSIALTHLGIPQPVRVCDGCYGRGGKPAGASTGAAGTSTPPSLSRTSSRADPPATAVADAVGRKEQEELDLAIALSLAESDQRRPSSNYQPPAQQQQQQQRRQEQASKAAKRVTFTDHGTSDEDDPDLARALAASLAELNMHDTPFSQPSLQRNDIPAARPASWGSSSSYADPAPSAAATTAPPATVAPPTAAANPSFVLTDVELDNIALFAAMMQQIDEQGRADAILGSREHAVLQQAMRDLHPRLLAWLHDTMATHKQLAELHTKVTDAMRRYEDAIDQQLRGPMGMPAAPAQVNATGMGMHPPYYAPPPPQQQQEMPYLPPPSAMTNGYAMPPPPMGPPSVVGPYAPPAAMGMPDLNAAAAPTPPPGYGPPGTVERNEPPNMYAPAPSNAPNYAYGPPPPGEYHAPPPQGGYPGPAVMGPPPGFGAPVGPVGSAPMAPPSGPPMMVGPPSGYAGQQQQAPAPGAPPAEVAPLIEL
ncbi:Vacuolar protein-sorting-associated protein 27 [Allomyces javanicus]|nr:Vacuolar protein-sorting-associated protein 27 [Allomyces javanicus]